MNQYNDYELLYLMSEFDEEAEKIFYDKYSLLIRSRIKKFNIKDRYQDDFFQEGMFMLFKAIQTFDEYNGKSFNKYFDLILQRRFINLLSKERHYFYDTEIIEDPDLIRDSQGLTYFSSNDLKLSDFEDKVFYYKRKNYKPNEIAKILNVEIKVVYNCLSRIRKKYKE